MKCRLDVSANTLSPAPPHFSLQQATVILHENVGHRFLCLGRSVIPNLGNDLTQTKAKLAALYHWAVWSECGARGAPPPTVNGVA